MYVEAEPPGKNPGDQVAEAVEDRLAPRFTDTGMMTQPGIASSGAVCVSEMIACNFVRAEGRRGDTEAREVIVAPCTPTSVSQE